MPGLFDSKYIFNLRIASSALAQSILPKPQVTGPIDILLCVVDHFEPHVGNADDAKARERMIDWSARYPKIASKHQDFDGRYPSHGFFYPWDEFDNWECDQIVEICRAGFGELDLHLHHFHDNEAGLREKIQGALEAFGSRGALSKWPDGRPAFGFIHGNWALDNSREENGKNYCGVNNEIDVLLDAGCYADFTFPAWKHMAQPQQFNDIHYAIDDPAAPKSYNRGPKAQVDSQNQSGLLLVQGPLVARRKGRRFMMDDADIAHYRRYGPKRLDSWVRCGIHVAGRPDRVFIKLHSHGAEDRNREVMLGADLEALFTDAEIRYNDGAKYRLHYVSAREMFNIIKATEAHAQGEINDLRNFVLKSPFGGG